MKNSGIILNWILFAIVVIPQFNSIHGQKSESSEPQTSLNTNLARSDAAPEERVVRMAYRKMNILDAVERVVKAKRSGQNAGSDLLQRSLRFDLRDFRVGPIDEIRDRTYRDLVTSSAGNVVQIMFATSSQNDGEGKPSIAAEWRAGQYAAGFDPQWTVADVLQYEAVRFNDVDRYASYEVTVSLEGQDRTYRALALFHAPTGQRGLPNPEFLDGIVGMGGVVTQVLRDTRMPLAMKRSPDRNSDQLSFVQNGNIPDGDKADADMKKPDDQAEVDMPQSNLASSPEDGPPCIEWYSTPIDPTYTYCMTWDLEAWGPVGNWGGGGGSSCVRTASVLNYAQIFDSNRTHHASGSHFARTAFQSACLVNDGCQQTCDVGFTISGFGESGELDESFYSHFGGTTLTRNGRTGPRDSEVSCETAIGYGFRRCIFDCTVQLNIGVSGQGVNASVTVSGGDLWNVGHIKGRTCRNGQ